MRRPRQIKPRRVFLRMPVINTWVKGVSRHVTPQHVKELALPPIHQTVLDARPVAACHRKACPHARPNPIEAPFYVLLLPIRTNSGHFCPRNSAETQTEDAAGGNSRAIGYQCSRPRGNPYQTN